MSTRTTAELATEVMRLPNWIDAMQDPDSQDAAHILRIYSDLYADWRVREIAYWAENAIPKEVFQHVVLIMVDAVGLSFNDPAPTVFDAETGQQVPTGKKGWNGLRRVLERKASKMPVRAEYF